MVQETKTMKKWLLLGFVLALVAGALVAIPFLYSVASKAIPTSFERAVPQAKNHPARNPIKVFPLGLAKEEPVSPGTSDQQWGAYLFGIDWKISTSLNVFPIPKEPMDEKAIGAQIAIPKG